VFTVQDVAEDVHVGESKLPKTPLKKSKKVNPTVETLPEMSSSTPQLGEIKPVGPSSDTTKTPKLDGFKKMLKKTKVVSATPRLDGARELMKTPKVRATPKFNGIRKLVKTPNAVATPNMDGVRQMLRTPRVQTIPELSEIRKMVKTPGGIRRERLSLSPAYDGVEDLLATPRYVDSLVDVSSGELSASKLSSSLGVVETDRSRKSVGSKNKSKKNNIVTMAAVVVNVDSTESNRKRSTSEGQRLHSEALEVVHEPRTGLSSKNRRRTTQSVPRRGAAEAQSGEVISAVSDVETQQEHVVSSNKKKKSRSKSLSRLSIVPGMNSSNAFGRIATANTTAATNPNSNVSAAQDVVINNSNALLSTGMTGEFPADLPVLKNVSKGKKRSLSSLPPLPNINHDVSNFMVSTIEDLATQTVSPKNKRKVAKLVEVSEIDVSGSNVAAVKKSKKKGGRKSLSVVSHVDLAHAGSSSTSKGKEQSSKPTKKRGKVVAFTVDYSSPSLSIDSTAEEVVSMDVVASVADAVVVEAEKVVVSKSNKRKKSSRVVSDVLGVLQDKVDPEVLAEVVQMLSPQLRVSVVGKLHLDNNRVDEATVDERSSTGAIYPVVRKGGAKKGVAVNNSVAAVKIVDATPFSPKVTRRGQVSKPLAIFATKNLNSKALPKSPKGKRARPSNNIGEISSQPIQSQELVLNAKTLPKRKKHAVNEVAVTETLSTVPAVQDQEVVGSEPETVPRMAGAETEEATTRAAVAKKKKKGKVATVTEVPSIDVNMVLEAVNVMNSPAVSSAVAKLQTAYAMLQEALVTMSPLMSSLNMTSDTCAGSPSPVKKSKISRRKPSAAVPGAAPVLHSTESSSSPQVVVSFGSTVGKMTKKVTRKTRGAACVVESELTKDGEPNVKVARRGTKAAPKTVDEDEIQEEISVPNPKRKNVSKAKMGSKIDSMDFVKAETASKGNAVPRSKVSLKNAADSNAAETVRSALTIGEAATLTGKGKARVAFDTVESPLILKAAGKGKLAVEVVSEVAIEPPPTLKAAGKGKRAAAAVCDAAAMCDAGKVTMPSPPKKAKATLKSKIKSVLVTRDVQDQMEDQPSVAEDRPSVAYLVPKLKSVPKVKTAVKKTAKTVPTGKRSQKVSAVVEVVPVRQATPPKRMTRSTK